MPETPPARSLAPPATGARLSLGRSGPVLPTSEHLRFQLDHALARDAVHAALDVPMLERGLHDRGLTPIRVQSAARDRSEYLRRPDLGRRLSANSEAALQQLTAQYASRQAAEPALAIVLADGLSALAVERHALPLLDALIPLIPHPCSLIPILLATNARVALGDAIGHALHARIALVLIGERPGLSSPDSLGAYLTWAPRPGRTDAARNCISNIRAEGLSYVEAAGRIVHYLREAERLQTTGIALKDPESTPRLPSGA